MTANLDRAAVLLLLKVLMKSAENAQRPGTETYTWPLNAPPTHDL